MLGRHFVGVQTPGHDRPDRAAETNDKTREGNDRKRDEDRIEDRASKDGFPVFPVVIRAALRLRVRFRRRLCG
mgnify:CR=1 FL=1